MKQWPLLQTQLTQTERQCLKCKAPVSWGPPRPLSNFLNLTEPAWSLQESARDEFLTKTNMQKIQHWSSSQGRSEGTGNLLQSMPGHEDKGAFITVKNEETLFLNPPTSNQEWGD